MNTREQIKKLAKLLNGEAIHFNWETYDYEEDIPHLYIYGKRVNICSVSISTDGLSMKVVTNGCEYFCDFYEDVENGQTFETIDKELEECGMDELLRDIYYEHPLSWAIGDYEDDFLTHEDGIEETSESQPM